MFMTVFTEAHHLSYPQPDQSSPRPLSCILKIVLYIAVPSTLRSCKLILYSGFPTRTLYALYGHFLSPNMLHAPPRPPRLLLFGHVINILRSKNYVAPHYVVLSTPCYLAPLRPKYLPQHPILQHPQTVFLPQCEQPSFTHTYNTTRKIAVVYILIFISDTATWKILDRHMVDQPLHSFTFLDC